MVESTHTCFPPPAIMDVGQQHAWAVGYSEFSNFFLQNLINVRGSIYVIFAEILGAHHSTCLDQRVYCTPERP